MKNILLLQNLILQQQGFLITDFKTDFDAKLQTLNKRITSNKTKHLLIENKFKNFEKFDAAQFRGKNHFDGDGI